MDGHLTSACTQLRDDERSELVSQFLQGSLVDLRSASLGNSYCLRQTSSPPWTTVVLTRRRLGIASRLRTTLIGDSSSSSSLFQISQPPYLTPDFSILSHLYRAAPYTSPLHPTAQGQLPSYLPQSLTKLDVALAALLKNRAV
jgi:hypothetical protein